MWWNILYLTWHEIKVIFHDNTRNIFISYEMNNFNSSISMFFFQLGNKISRLAALEINSVFGRLLFYVNYKIKFIETTCSLYKIYIIPLENYFYLTFLSKLLSLNINIIERRNMMNYFYFALIEYNYRRNFTHNWVKSLLFHNKHQIWISICIIHCRNWQHFLTTPLNLYNNTVLRVCILGCHFENKKRLNIVFLSYRLHSVVLSCPRIYTTCTTSLSKNYE